MDYTSLCPGGQPYPGGRPETALPTRPRRTAHTPLKKYIDRRSISCYYRPIKAAERRREGGLCVSISADLLRGHTDAIILAQLMGGDSYGYAINKRIQQRTGGAYGFKEATLYTAFKRLEGAGLIRSYWGEEGPGARRRYYSVTGPGRERWAQVRREWEQARALLDGLITLQDTEQEDERHV